MQWQDSENIRRLLESALEELDAISEKRCAAVSTSASGAGAGRIENPVQPAIEPYPTAHPGLQRFVNIEPDSSPSVPRPCFMEPERQCVHSGACEMRGF